MSFLNKIKAERIDVEDSYNAPFFHQQQAAYTFCQAYIRNKNVLEIGCGSGFGAYRLSKYSKKFYAIDKDFRSISNCRERYLLRNLKFEHALFDNFNTKKKYDVILALQVIEHILDVNSFLRKTVLFLKKNGTLIISTPNASTQSYNENPYHYKEFTSSELKKLLSDYFENVNMFGVQGDKIVERYEQQRRAQVLVMLHKDKWNIRRFIPRIIKQFIFDIMSYYRKKLAKSRTKIYGKISETSFRITKNQIKKSIDIVAVCRK